MSKSQGRSQIALHVYLMQPNSPSNDDGSVLGSVYEKGTSCRDDSFLKKAADNDRGDCHPEITRFPPAAVDKGKITVVQKRKRLRDRFCRR
jgi:hypothetical protein